MPKEGVKMTEYKDYKSILKQEIDENKYTAGANILVIQDGREVLYEEYGFRDIKNKAAFSRDTIMRLYSMSKPITSAAVMILVDRGLLDLSACLFWMMPGFSPAYVLRDGKRVKSSSEITVKDLMNMTSGLPYPGDTGASMQVSEVFSELSKRLYSDNPMTTAEFSERIGGCDLCFEPGERFMYGSSADILGALIENVSKMRFGEFLRREIFEPLGMNDMGFWVPPEKRNRLAKVYSVDYSKFELVQAPEKGNHLGINYAMDFPPAFESGGAGLVSTLDDYAKFALMLIGGGEYNGRRILSERAARYMTSPGLLPWQREDLNRSWRSLCGYSYGNLMRHCVDPGQAHMLTEYGEYGWDGWLGCYFGNFPKSRLTVLIGTQRTDSGTSSLTRKLVNAVMSDFGA